MSCGSVVLAGDTGYVALGLSRCKQTVGFFSDKSYPCLVGIGLNQVLFDLRKVYVLNLKTGQTGKHLFCRQICKLRSFLNQDSTVLPNYHKTCNTVMITTNHNRFAVHPIINFECFA